MFKIMPWTLLLKDMYLAIFFSYFIFMRIKLQTNRTNQSGPFSSIASVQAGLTAEGSPLKVLVIHELYYLDTIG